MASTFERLNALIMRHSGQALSTTMQGRLVASLEAQARAQGHSDPESYLRDLENPRLPAHHEALQEFINLHTVGKTLFYRYPDQLALLVEILLPEVDRLLPPAAPLRIWSAACSTGEEPYTIAMALTDRGWFTPGRRHVHILATDINTRHLAFAKGARVHPLRLDSLPPAQRHHLVQDAQGLRVAPQIVTRVAFERVNLVDPTTYPQVNGGWHVVICANVLFYFQRETSARVAQSLCSLMAPQGAFFLGGAETLPSYDASLRPIRYRGAFAFWRGATPPAIGALRVDEDAVSTPPPASRSSGTDLPALPLAPAPETPQRAVPVPERAACETHDVVAEAQAYIKRGDRRLAIMRLRAAAGQGGDGRTTRMLGILLLKDGAFVEASRVLDDATARDPFAFDLHYYSGLAFARQKLALEAVESLRKALFLDPTRVVARLEFADQLSASGDKSRAIAEYEKVIADLKRNAPIGLDGYELGHLLEERWLPRADMLMLVEGRTTLLKAALASAPA